MAQLLTPKINTIIRMTEFDVLRTSIKMGNMYMCLDTFKLYYDESENRRVLYNYNSVRTINDLQYNITPTLNGIYYCWEDNSLWIWLNKWVALYSDTTYPSAYVYSDVPNKNNPQELSSIYNQPSSVIDNNGLLKDGSVVIRDRNRIIKGKILIDDGNDNLIISSFLGGGIRFLPNGKLNTEGELLIGDDGVTTLRSELHTLNNEFYVDYSEKPEDDISEYPNEKHQYKVFHEGNLDTSAIKVMTPRQIYDKLLDDSLPSPLAFNVASVGGKTIDDISLVGHKHKSIDITDLVETVRTQSLIQVRTIFNNMSSSGITSSYNSATDILTLNANDFTITLTGAVSGSATIQGLTNTSLETSIDPNKHIHQDYIDTMNRLQSEIDGISTVDPNNYYVKETVDALIDSVRGTEVPTVNKALLVNNEGILPVTCSSAKQLDHNIKMDIYGDILGTVTFNGSENAISISTSFNEESLYISNLVETKVDEKLSTDIDALLKSRSFIGSYGDGSQTEFTILHNLNSEDIIVQFRDINTNQELFLSNAIIDVNSISVSLETPIQFKVYITKL